MRTNVCQHAFLHEVFTKSCWKHDKPEGAEASAISYSIAETALANGLTVYKYITYVLEKRPTEEMADRKLEKLLPWNDKVFEMCKIER